MSCQLQQYADANTPATRIPNRRRGGRSKATHVTHIFHVDLVIEIDKKRGSKTFSLAYVYSEWINLEVTFPRSIYATRMVDRVTQICPCCIVQCAPVLDVSQALRLNLQAIVLSVGSEIHIHRAGETYSFLFNS